MLESQLTHREVKDLFVAAIDRELGAEAPRFEHHLEGCVDCRQGYQRYARVVERVRAVERERAPPALSSLIALRLRRKRSFFQRDVRLAHAHYRVPVEIILPLLLAAVVAALLLLVV